MLKQICSTLTPDTTESAVPELAFKRRKLKTDPIHRLARQVYKMVHKQPGVKLLEKRKNHLYYMKNKSRIKTKHRRYEQWREHQNY